MTPAWLLGFLPIVGSSIFLFGILLSSPFVAVWQWTGFHVLALGKETIEIHELGIRVIKEHNIEFFLWEDIEKVIERFELPFFRFVIVVKNKNDYKLNPFTTFEPYLREFEARNVPLELARVRDEEATLK